MQHFEGSVKLLLQKPPCHVPLCIPLMLETSQEGARFWRANVPNARVVRGRQAARVGSRRNRCAGANVLAILQCPNAPSGAPQPLTSTASTDAAGGGRASIWFGWPCALAATNVERTRGKCGLGGPARTHALLPRASAPQSFSCCSPISACSPSQARVCLHRPAMASTSQSDT